MPRHAALVLSSLLCAPGALAQSAQRAAFVANNGNLEGSVSSYLVHANGTLEFRQKLVIGSRPNSQVYVPGTNCQTISLSPGGRFLAAGHGTSSDTVEQLTILEVHADQTMTVFGVFQVADSPLCVRWVSDTLLAVTRTAGSPSNSTDVYRFNPGAVPLPTLTLADSRPSGSFTSWLAVHPHAPIVYSESTGANTVFPFLVGATGTLTPMTPFPSPCYPLGIGVSPNGARLYAGGGISGSGHAVMGASIDGAGQLSGLPGSPFASLGSSPKQVVVSSDNKIAFVAHGTDSTVRSFLIDSATGALSSTGFSIAVGIQGSLGQIGALDNLLLVLDRDTINDGVKGLLSFTIHADGSFAQNGPLVDSQGVTPNELALWSPPACPGDANGDRVVNFADLNDVLTNYGASGAPGSVPGDTDADGDCDFADLNSVLTHYGQSC